MSDAKTKKSEPSASAPSVDRAEDRRKRARNVRRVLVVALALLVLGTGRMRLGDLPPLEGRDANFAILDTEETRLGRALAPAVRSHPGLSGIHPLFDARAAFAARVLLARSADRTLDLQYYIWRNDLSGTLLFEGLRAAADRGVRVRLLLDDHPVTDLDETLRMLDAHPNIEVRLFNPYVIRKPRFLNALSSASRLNRRIHNKSFTADSQVTIVGGRNIGDEYFGATDGVLFSDLDVAAVGAVVPEVSRDSDRYWNCGAAFPIRSLAPPRSPVRLNELRMRARRIFKSDEASEFREALRETAFVRDLLNGTVINDWAPTRLVSDDPNKVFGRAPRKAHLGPQLEKIIGAPEKELALVSAYFVPGKDGTEAFTEMVARGIDVKVLTNSLEATDVAIVQSGYAKRRKALLRGGVRLYELLRSGGDERTGAGGSGSSRSSLHAKTFAVDRTRLFVGSFNFDPRSNHLNTELGFVIDSPLLASEMSERFEERIPKSSYEVVLNERGKLEWIEYVTDEETIRHTTEPGARWWERAAVKVLARLPIEWLL